MSSGHKRVMCPECGQQKPSHGLGCRFGLALAQGAAQADVDAMHPQVRRLRNVVANQVHQPVSLTDAGVSDLVTRVTRAVMDHLDLTGDAMDLMLGQGMIRTDRCPECGEPYRAVLVGTPDEGKSCTHKSGCTWVWTRPESPYGPTVDGIRPHRPVTPEQDARMKATAEQWEKDNPMTPERAAAMLAGRVKVDGKILEKRIQVAPDSDSAIRAPVPCPGCGAVPKETRHGRATLHAETCPATRDRALPESSA